MAAETETQRVLLTGAIAAPLAQMSGGDGGMGWGTVMMVVMIVAMLLFVALVVVGVIWGVRSLRREGGGPDRGDGGALSAVRALERRYAEGEIDVDEYSERRSVLERRE